MLFECALMLLLSTPPSSTCVFPGATNECSAPDASAVVEWREPAGAEAHQLWLRVGNSASQRVFLFQRSVELLWSPDARVLAITDRASSNESLEWVLDIAAPETLVKIEDAFIKRLGKLPAVYRNGHRYFEALRWSSSSVLEFQVRAYDAEPGREFRREYVYDRGGSVSAQD